MLSCQKHLFQLPAGGHYLNCAYMSPLLRAVEEAGIKAMQQKRNPANIKPQDFFTDAAKTRALFAALIKGSALQTVIIPSASYGLQTAVNNLPLNKGDHVLMVGDEFPSGYYSVQHWCRQHSKSLKIIEAPAAADSGQAWTEKILEAINADTTAVLMSSVHWTGGTKFDLQQIGKRCRELGALFIVDGTQSVGALAIDVKEYCIDALVCACYKWLLGPYSTGLAYFSEYFDNGSPLENSWLNRSNAAEFSTLTKYTDEYTAGAGRYNMGEFSNFIHIPMINQALTQITTWGVPDIQEYCGKLIEPLIQFLQQNNFAVQHEAYRCNHLFGLSLPPHIDKQKLLQQLQEKQIAVSVRGEAIRIAVHVFNDENDMAALINALNAV